MTIQKKSSQQGVSSASSTQRGNFSAEMAARQARNTIEHMIEPALTPKLRDLSTKKERLLAVADAIEQAALVKDGIGFNMAPFYTDLRDEKTREKMDQWLKNVGRDQTTDTFFEDKTGHACKTVACIAGWTSLLDDPSNKDSESMDRRASDILDLTREESRTLFYGSGAYVDRENITDKHAVAVLRDFAENGKVRWGKFNSDGTKKR